VRFRAISPDQLRWITRPHDEGEPARHVAENEHAEILESAI
jgi:hypothetical protein